MASDAFLLAGPSLVFCFMLYFDKEGMGVIVLYLYP